MGAWGGGVVASPGSGWSDLLIRAVGLAPGAAWGCLGGLGGVGGGVPGLGLGWAGGGVVEVACGGWGI